MKLILGILALTIAPVLAHADGGEIGNAFIPFASKIGKFSLEYAKTWRLNDIAPAASFADTKNSSIKDASFFYINAETSPDSMNSLAEYLKGTYGLLPWAPVSIGGLSGLQATQPNGVTLIFLLRPQGEMVSIRMKSADGDRSNEVLDHMLKSLRVE